jgi:hypothetical protein
MHARIDQLLNLRDEAPVAADIRAHVRDCAECAGQLAASRQIRDRLRALPVAPAPDAEAWTQVEARVADVHRRRRRVARLVPLAAAASVVALAVFSGMRWMEAREGAAETSVAVAAAGVSRAGELAELQARSQALEEVLAALPARPAVERAATSVPIDSLEAQVQWLDHQLTLADADGGAPQEQQLWRDRVEVMNSLVQLRYVEAQQFVN